MSPTPPGHTSTCDDANRGVAGRNGRGGGSTPEINLKKHKLMRNMQPNLNESPKNNIPFEYPGLLAKL